MPSKLEATILFSPCVSADEVSALEKSLRGARQCPIWKAIRPKSIKFVSNNYLGFSFGVRFRSSLSGCSFGVHKQAEIAAEIWFKNDFLKFGIINSPNRFQAWPSNKTFGFQKLFVKPFAIRVADDSGPNSDNP